VTAFTPLNWFFWALAVAALIVEVWAFVDAVRRPTSAFPAAGKQTKPLWLIILGVAAAIGLYSATRTSGIGVVVSILPVAAFIAAAIYLTDVRPKVRDMGRGSGGSSHMGPYGPW
jgi:predicted membrane metal-binding protein